MSDGETNAGGPGLPDGRILDVLAIFLMAMFILPGLTTWLTGFVVEQAVPGSRILAGVRRAELLIGLYARSFGFAGLTVASVAYGYGRPVSAIGILPRRWWKEAGVGLFSGASLVLVNMVAGYLSVLLLGLFTSQETAGRLVAREEGILQGLLSPGQPGWQLVGILVLVNLVAPVAEEIFFRGFTYEVFKDHWGGRMAKLGTALLFGGAHGYIAMFLPVFLVGLFLAHLYERRGSLVACIVAHACLNIISSTVLYFNPVSN
ncbi:MAG: CPBP family intramembrane metalloprotease [Firmicutes bacterium]|nr:CPBP family intramembrane metalloprotease [Bacillota bacterium]